MRMTLMLCGNLKFSLKLPHWLFSKAAAEKFRHRTIIDSTRWLGGITVSSCLIRSRILAEKKIQTI